MKPLPPIEHAKGYDLACRRVIGFAPWLLGADILIALAFDMVRPSLPTPLVALAVIVSAITASLALFIAPRSRTVLMSREELGFARTRDALLYSRMSRGIPRARLAVHLLLFGTLIGQGFLSGHLFGMLPIFTGIALVTSIGAVLRRWPIDALEKVPGG